MDVEVVIEAWGNYKKGDIVKNLPISTAEACIKTGKVKQVGTETTEVKPSKKKKKEDE